MAWEAEVGINDRPLLGGRTRKEPRTGFYDMMSGWGGGFLGWPMYLGMIAFWVAVVVLVVWLVKAVAGPSQPAAAGPARPESPLETLKRRYAAGEIDSAEYQRRKADIV